MLDLEMGVVDDALKVLGEASGFIIGSPILGSPTYPRQLVVPVNSD